jgi:hypothetical protein
MKSEIVMAYDFTLGYQGALRYSAGAPQPRRAVPEPSFELAVVFTGMQNTLAALRQAGRLARGLNSRIRLIVPQVVPYPLDLDSPPVLPEFSKRRFEGLAAAQRIETRIEIFLCRDGRVVLDQVLPARSTVLIGGRKRWWPTAE